MKKVGVTFTLFMIFTKLTFSQNVFDQTKYVKCLLEIGIDYKDLEANYEESKKYADIEIIIINMTSNGKIKTVERGYIRNWQKNGKKGVFFEAKSFSNSQQRTAKFPIFNAKDTYCYNAECYDKQ